MLEELHITDFALIDEALIEFGPGLNVLTGETGAGKTILLAALGLVLGERADSTSVRSGAKTARVEGRFRDDSASELVLSRSVSRDGKSRCYANGSLVTVGALAELGDRLVDLHGQHEHQALLRAANHVEYLDRFCGPEQSERRREWQTALARLREVESERGELKKFALEHGQRRELLEFQVDEIGRAELRPEEEAEIASSLEVLRNAEKLAAAAGGARECLAADDEGAALETTRRAIAAIQGVGGVDTRLDELASRLEACGFEMEEIAGELRAYSENVEFDQEALNGAEARMALIGELKRKYGATIDDIAQHAARASEELAQLGAGPREMSELEDERDRLEAELGCLANDLREARHSAASRFEEEMREQLSALAMRKAQFVAEVTPLEERGGLSWGTTGADNVEFLFSSNAGEVPKPLVKIASGGEISRLMLAAKIVLGDADEVPSLVFDEIDAGVGGKTAAAVGAKLALLARTSQVICVTHLPQIASLASHHLSVSKAEAKGRMTTRVSELTDERRVGEIARMLSGAEVSETSMDHARAMLEGR